MRNIGFVNYNSIGWYVTFPNDASYSNLNVSSTTNAFPLIYTLAGAGLIAYVSEYDIFYDIFIKFLKYILDIALLVVHINIHISV